MILPDSFTLGEVSRAVLLIGLAIFGAMFAYILLLGHNHKRL